MAKNTSPLPRIITQLRDVLAATRYTMMADVEPLVEQAFILLGFEKPDKPATQLNVSDLAYNIAMILDNTQDNSVIRLCLGILLRLGGMGEILAAAYLRKNKLAKETLLATLDTFAPQYKLSLANRFFRHPHKREPWFLRWAHDVVRNAQGEDPEEVLLFLEAIPESEGELSNPLQRELLRGRFGVWLQRLLHLELDPEQLEFMIRTTGRLRSHQVAMSLARSLGGVDEVHKDTQGLKAELLQCVGACGRKRDPLLVNRVLSFVRSEREAVVLAALRGLAALRAEKLPQALAYAYVNREEMRQGLLPLLLRLDAVELRIFLERLPRVERLELLPRLAALFASFNPLWMREALRRQAANGADEEGDWRQLVQAMERFLLAHPPLSREADYRPAPASGTKLVETQRSSPAQESAAQALLERMKRTMAGKERQQSSEGRGATPTGKELRAKLQGGGELRNLNLDGERLPDLEIRGATLSHCTASTCNFAQAALDSVVFEKCVLRNLDMEGAWLREVEFRDCELVNCRLASSRLEGVRFRKCAIHGGQFSNGVSREVEFRRCGLLECDFSGSLLEGFQAWACRMQAAHFAYVQAREPVFQGVEFSDCRFYKTSIERGVVRNCVASTSAFVQCRFYDLDTDEPAFLGQERETIVQGTARAATLKLATMAPQLGSAAGTRLFFKLVEQWFFEKGLKESEATFLANNRRRLDWALCMLPAPADDFLRMLPAVLESPGPLPGSRTAEPVCAIHGYVPDFATMRLLEQYKVPPGPEGEERDTAVPIEGLYTIGSTGTIAHARFSDIDLWVCYDPADLPPESVRALEEKLQRVEAWAGEAFGVEVHFFLMDLQSVRHNEFGYTDKESAGSSQARLLKEEFYRTGVYLAGKKPFWWYLPVGVDTAGYQRHFQRFRRAVGPLDRSVLDLGHLEDIPRSEFFGASLWQIVKAIKSPFKSAMKLALLDKYTHSDDVAELLCNRLKRNLFDGGKDLWDIDPYALMFREIFEYYEQSEDKDAQDLMRLAFLQKTGLYLAAQGTGRFYEMQDYSYMEYFFPYSEADIASHVEPGRGLPAEQVKLADSHAELVELGQKMVRFMLRTYETIHKLWSDRGLDMRVTEEDMTKLGRKVSSYLSPRPFKVMRIPFMDAGKSLFSTLEFIREGLAGKPGTWVVRGEAPKRKGKRSRKEEVHRSRLLEPLLVWLVANNVYAPAMPLQAGGLEYPLTLGDIDAMLRALDAFFSPAEIFDTDINEYLRKERVARVFLSINYTQPREERRVRAVTIVYSTNWGELFCRPANKDFQVLYQDPLRFVRANLDLDVGVETRITAFLPPKSLCPPVRIL